MDRAPGTLEIAFSWLGDRYGHRLTWRQAGEVWAEAESVEGSSGPDRAGESLATDPSHSSAEPTSDPAWPPSPPWQQVTEHARGQLLLLGMACSRPIRAWFGTSPAGSRARRIGWATLFDGLVPLR